MVHLTEIDILANNKIKLAENLNPYKYTFFFISLIFEAELPHLPKTPFLLCLLLFHHHNFLHIFVHF